MPIYSKSSGFTEPIYGKFQTPIKMIIEHESDLMTKKGGACSWLYNVEKSNRFGETILREDSFNIFSAVAEGNAAPRDTSKVMYSKFIEHIQFMKEFVVTAEMMEDAVTGIAVDAKRRAQNFVRSYYKTMNKLCEFALYNGTQSSAYFTNAKIDLTVEDTPLFNGAHIYADDPSNTQSNYFWGDALCTGESGNRVVNPEVFASTLYKVASSIRNMKDDNFEILGYTADTIILPGNRPILEAVAKSVCGSEQVVGSANNDINLHCGNWNIVILPSWQANDDRYIVMSSEANKNLGGNMFFNRVPLTISDWVDHHTGNYIWCGRCRFGIGFGSYKHIAMVVDSTTSITNATPLS